MNIFVSGIAPYTHERPQDNDFVRPEVLLTHGVPMMHFP